MRGVSGTTSSFKVQSHDGRAYDARCYLQLQWYSARTTTLHHSYTSFHMHSQFVVDLEVDRQDDFLNRGHDRVSVPSGDVVLQSQARVDDEDSTLGGGNGPSL